MEDIPIVARVFSGLKTAFCFYIGASNRVPLSCSWTFEEEPELTERQFRLNPELKGAELCDQSGAVYENVSDRRTCSR